MSSASQPAQCTIDVAKLGVDEAIEEILAARKEGRSIEFRVPDPPQSKREAPDHALEVQIAAKENTVDKALSVAGFDIPLPQWAVTAELPEATCKLADSIGQGWVVRHDLVHKNVGIDDPRFLAWMDESKRLLRTACKVLESPESWPRTHLNRVWTLLRLILDVDPGWKYPRILDTLRGGHGWPADTTRYTTTILLGETEAYFPVNEACDECVRGAFKACIVKQPNTRCLPCVKSQKSCPSKNGGILVDGLKMTSTSTKPRAAVGNTTAVSTGNKRKLKNDAEGSGSRKHRVLSVQDKTVAPEILAAMKEQPLDGLEVAAREDMAVVLGQIAAELQKLREDCFSCSRLALTWYTVKNCSQNDKKSMSCSEAPSCLGKNCDCHIPRTAPTLRCVHCPAARTTSNSWAQSQPEEHLFI